jgi:hypothetical protein
MKTTGVTTKEFRRVVEYITNLYKNKITPQDCDAEHLLNICHDNEYTEKIVELAIVLAKNKGTCRKYLIDTLL